MTATATVMYLGQTGRAVSASFASPPSPLVAFVTHVPKTLGSITRFELRRAVMQVAADEGITSIGRVERRRYRHIQNTALKLLLSITYIEGEASEQGVVVTERQVSAKVMAIKQANFQSEREYRQFLRERKLTAQEARQRVRAQLLDERVIERVLKDASGTAAEEDALREFVKGFRIRWWGRTSCTKTFDIAPCTAGLTESATGPTATFESDELGNTKGAGPGNASDGWVANSAEPKLPSGVIQMGYGARICCVSQS